MTVESILFQERHFAELKAQLLSHPEGKERVAFVLFGASIIGGEIARLLSHDFYVVPDDALVSNSQGHVTWDNAITFPFLKRCRNEGLHFGIVHSHIGVPADFSSIDDDGERSLSELVRHRNGANAILASTVISTDSSIDARVWKGTWKPRLVSQLWSIGKRFLMLRTPAIASPDDVLHRQVLALGSAFRATVRELNIVIVGAGGTGSAVAMLLARLGIGTVTLIDPDVVEASNLNRLHGAGMADAEERRPKVDAVRDSIVQMGLRTQVNTVAAKVSSPTTWSYLKAADVIFGCTDDNLGRLLLNRWAYFFVTPVIDLGLAIEVTRDEPPEVVAMDGRVTVLYPGATCLMCRGVIDVVRAREEGLKDANPDEYQRQKEEAYVIGEGDPAPSVVTFTTEVATMAVSELIQRIQGYRGRIGSTDSRTRQFHRMHDLRPGDPPKEDCPICGDRFYWGRGDVDPFLDQVW